MSEKDGETEAEIMTVKAGETKSTASGRMLGRTRGPQKAGPRCRCGFCPLVFEVQSCVTAEVSFITSLRERERKKKNTTETEVSACFLSMA